MYPILKCTGAISIAFHLQSKYRDRAKERRDKYGTPAIVPGWKKRLEREKEKAAYST